MLRYFVLFGLLFSFASAQTTTTWPELTRENTSACSGTDSAPLPCYQVFQRMTDLAGFAPDGNGGHYTALTPYFNPAATNISGPLSGNARSFSVRRLLPEGFGNVNIPIFVHYMPWFYQNSTDHVATGYTSYEPAVILEHLRDIGARDFDGVIIDWNGFARPLENLATQRLRDNIGGKYNVRGIQLTFALMLDKGVYFGPSLCGAVAVGDQVRCVQEKIEDNMLYAGTEYFGTSNYLTATTSEASGTRPVLFTFVKEDGSLRDGGGQMFTSCTAQVPCSLLRPVNGDDQCRNAEDCWDKIWQGSLEHFESEKHYRPIMVFRNSGIFPPISQEPLPPGTYRHYNGIRHIQSEGMYAWVNPSSSGWSTITNTSQAPQAAGFPNLVDFYREGFCTLLAGMNCAAFIEDSRTKATANRVGMRTIGAVYKGFDNYLAPFDQQPTIKPENHRVMDQNCGQTWLDSWKQIMVPSQTIGDQLNIIQVATWNDYDEGTAIEMGIENCVSLSTAIERDANGARVNWTLNTGLQNTIDHFEVFATSDDYNFLVLNDNVLASARSYDLTQHTNLGNQRLAGLCKGGRPTGPYKQDQFWSTLVRKRCNDPGRVITLPSQPSESHASSAATAAICVHGTASGRTTPRDGVGLDLRL